MNQLEAFRETIALAERKGMPPDPETSRGLAHLRRMLEQVEAGVFSPAKLGRWLGWAQCAVVAACPDVTLEDMKAINRKHADDDGDHPRVAWEEPIPAFKGYIGPIPFCKNCRHFVFSTRFAGRRIGNRCALNIWRSRNLETGVIDAELQLASVTRQDGAPCGPMGKLFEAKEAADAQA